MTPESKKIHIILKEHDHFGQLRTILIDGKVWFIATDIAKSLGYQRPNDAIAYHCKHVKSLIISDAKSKTDTYPLDITNRYDNSASNLGPFDIIDENGNPFLSTSIPPKIISQGDIFRLVAHSRLPSAQKIEDWIFDEVIPSILEKGHYALKPMTEAQYLVKIANEMLRAEEERLHLQKKQHEHDTRLNTLEEYKEQKQLEQEQSHYNLFNLTDNAEPPAEKTTRSLINEIIRQYAITKGLPINQVWIKVYADFRHRYHIDLMTRAKNETDKIRKTRPKSKKIIALDIAENLNMLDDLLKVTQHICKQSPP